MLKRLFDVIGKRMRPCAMVVLCAVNIVGMARTTAAAAQADEPELKIEPRWGTVWVSPQLSANWVILRYTHHWTKENAPSGKVIIDLPAGVKCISAIEMPFAESASPSGGVRVTLDPVNLFSPELKGGFLYLSTTLPPGTTGKGQVWAEWDGGGQKSAVTDFDVRVIEVPSVAQPKKLWPGASMWPYMIANWPDYYRQYASMGFTHQNLWHTAIYHTQKPDPVVADIVSQSWAAGVSTSIDSSIFWGPEITGENPDPSNLALFVDGTRSGPCPSYRGPAFEEWLGKLARISESGISFLISDEETYGGGNYANACVCPRCEERWKQWLKENRPELHYKSQREVIAGKPASSDNVIAYDQLEQKHEGVDAPTTTTTTTTTTTSGAGDADAKQAAELYRAWLYFRASLTTERYQIFRKIIEKAVAQNGEPKSSPKPMLGWWASAAEDYTLAVCMQDGRSLSGVIDPIVPQLYFRYQLPMPRFREAVRRHCWATGGGATTWAGLDSDDYDTQMANTPGVLTAAVLETLMAGGRGYCMWLGARMDTRQWAELAAVNGAMAQHENTFVDGKETDLFRAHAPEGKGDYFHPWSKEVFVSTRETADEGLMLISDYRATRTPFWVERSNAFRGPMVLTDAFTGEVVARLSENQWDFLVQLKDWPVRLLVWNKSAH
jgi:hypothetical protein